MMNSELVVCIFIAIDISVSVVNLILSILYHRKIMNNKRINSNKFSLSAFFGKRNYNRLVKDCNSDCDDCPFTVCFNKECLEYKERVLRNDSEVSVWIKPKYKEK